MTERARLWRWMDLLALAGLIVLLVGLPASGGAGDGDGPYASATSFEVPWPRIGDHIVYDLIVDDENGLRNYPAIMEVQRRMAVPGEVPVDAPYVEERVFRPMYVNEGNFLLDSRGWTDKTYYLPTGERAYATGDGIRPDYGQDHWGTEPIGWLHAEWEGQIGSRYSDTDHWWGFGHDVRHTPDDASTLASMWHAVTQRPDPTLRINTNTEAVYADQRLYGIGFGADDLAAERLYTQVFPPEFDQVCRLDRMMHSILRGGQMPVVVNWSIEENDCRDRSGPWMHAEHAGRAGIHGGLQWKDGRRISVDIVPRVLNRGDGPEYRPITNWADMDKDDVTKPVRNVSPPEVVSVLAIDEDLRPVVRNVSLAMLKQALIQGSPPDCLTEFFNAGAHIVSVSWFLKDARILPDTVTAPIVDIPWLPTGHAPGDAITRYHMDWKLGLMTESGQAMMVSVGVLEQYPGPVLEFVDWTDWGDGPCLPAGQTKSPGDVMVVPPPILAEAAEKKVVRALDLPPGARDTAVGAFTFEPAFDWIDPKAVRQPMSQAGWGMATLSQSIRTHIPSYDFREGYAAYGNHEHNGTRWVSPMSGVLSVDDGGIVQEIQWSPSTDATATTASIAAPPSIDVLAAKPMARDAGLVLVFSWVVLRLVAAIRLGALFPAVAWLYAKVRDADVLLHERRSAIMELLRADPGLTVTDVSKRLGLAWGATVHHVDRLKQAGLVRSVRDGRRRRFVVTEAGVSTAEALAKSPERARLIQVLEKEPGLTAAELAERLSRDRTSVARMAARLVDASVLERRRDGRKVRFYPRPMGP